MQRVIDLPWSAFLINAGLGRVVDVDSEVVKLVKLSTQPGVRPHLVKSRVSGEIVHQIGCDID